MRKLLLASAACVTLGWAGTTANAAQVYEMGATGLSKSAPSGKVKPGQLVAHIDMRINTYVEADWNSGNSTAAGFKSSPIGIVGYGRLYAGVDGMTTSGLKYGLVWEIRENNQDASKLGSGSDLSPGTSAASGTGTLFWRRNYFYIGTDQLGTVRLGQTDGPYTLLLTGTFDDFGTGGWDGDLPAGFGPTWPWPDVGNVYTSGKVVYLSPKIYGLDAGISFEPSTANMVVGFNNQSYVSTSNLASDLSRRRNTIEAGVRYKGAFGGFGIAASALGMFGGHVNPGPLNPGINGVTKFDNIALGDFGVALTFAGVTFGGNYEFGAMNGQFGLKPDGGSNAQAWVVGAEYAFGPLLVGAAYFQYQYQGTVGAATQRRDTGLQIGANYNLAPGLQLIAEYLYGNSRQNGVSPSGSTPGGPGFYNQEQAVGVGFQMRW